MIAAVGLACGVGFFLGAVVTTVLALVGLFVLQPVSHLARRWSTRRSHGLVVQVEAGRRVADVDDAIQDYGQGSLEQLRLGTRREGRTVEIAAELWGSHESNRLGVLADRLGDRPGSSLCYSARTPPATRAFHLGRRGPVQIMGTAWDRVGGAG